MPSISPTISRVRMFRQYLRWLPDKLGLVNHGAFLMQLREIRNDDTFIVSYPKSGNTWLRFALAYMITGEESKLTFKEVDKLVPDVYVSKDEIDSMPPPRFIKTHDTLFPYFPKAIYIVRDYRDVLVSYYHYKLALKEYSGDFSAFIRSDEVIEPFGSWAEHVGKATEFQKNTAAKILFLRYEDLQTSFEKTVNDIVRFCGFSNVNSAKLKELTQFEKLRDAENESGSEFKNRSEQNFFREGKSGKWQSYFTTSDLEYLYSNEAMVSLFKQLGYEK